MQRQCSATLLTYCATARQLAGCGEIRCRFESLALRSLKERPRLDLRGRLFALAAKCTRSCGPICSLTRRADRADVATSLQTLADDRFAHVGGRLGTIEVATDAGHAVFPNRALKVDPRNHETICFAKSSASDVLGVVIHGADAPEVMYSCSAR